MSTDSNAPAGSNENDAQTKTHLQLQYAVAEALSSAPNDQGGCAEVIRAICLALRFKWGAFWLREETNLRLVESHGATAEMEGFASVSSALRFAPGEGLPGRVWREGAPVWIPDFGLDATLPRRAAAVNCGLHAALAFPIRGQEFLGAFEFISDEMRPPDANLLHMMSAVGAQVGQFIERKRAELALAESQSLFLAVFNGAQDAILLTNDFGEIIEANPAATKLLGLTRSSLLRRKVWSILPKSGETDGAALWKDFLRSGTQNTEVTVRQHGDRSADVDYRAVARIVPGVHLSILRDITERKQREQQTRLLNKELEARIQERTAALRESNTQMEAFCYSVSHDLRAPLRSMQGFSRALLDDYGDILPQEGRDFARRIVAASEHMDGLLADVLAYSRLTRQELKPEIVDVAEVVEDAKLHLIAEVRQRDAVIETIAKCRVRANRAVLELILMNLIENAIKFVPKERQPRVRVEAELRDRACRIWVRDNGIGISPEHHQRIFRIFERLHGVESYPGTGIGLALVQKAAERMGGSCGVESAPGEGSAFWIELPAEIS